MNIASIPNFSFLGVANILARVAGWVGGWVGLTVIIGLVSVQLALNLPTGTELGNTFFVVIFYVFPSIICLVSWILQIPVFAAIPPF